MIKGYLKVTILKELSSKECSGYGLIKKIGETLEKKPSAGSVYPLLGELHSKGLVSIKQEGRKKNYHITSKGRKAISRLLKEKEALMLKHLEIIKILENVTGEKPCSDIELHKSMDLLVRNIDIWSELKSTLLNIAMDSKKEIKIRRALKNVIKELKRI